MQTDVPGGLDELKQKLGHQTIYDGVPAIPSDRHFFNGLEVFDRLIEAVRPRVIVEVGTWMGHSAIHMTKAALRHVPDVTTICVDTWLGSVEHYFNDAYLRDLALTNGRPSFYNAFLSNVAWHGLQKHILPLSCPSTTAAEILQKLGIMADLIYIDAGHGYDDVSADLSAYSKLLLPSGVMFGDDYFYRPLRQAVDDHAAARQCHVAAYGERAHKWVLVRSRDYADQVMGDTPLKNFV